MILPDWWNDDCASDSSLLPEIEIRVARFLGISIADVRDPNVSLVPALSQGAQLRQIGDISRERLAPAIHSAQKIAEAVVRNLRDEGLELIPLPSDGLAWREGIDRTKLAVALPDILNDLWGRGIPVVPVASDVLPSPSFQGAAFIVDGRPVIVTSYKYDAPGRVAFLLAHEAGHIAAGDCRPHQPVVDADEDVIDRAEIELRADRYATLMLVGSDAIPRIEGRDFRELANTAIKLERADGADAGALIFTWARHSGDYQAASLAVRALYRDKGAMSLLREHFWRHVSLDSASESDRALLECVSSETVRIASAR